jgi:multimeric flavodoxin WrbA
MDEKAESFRNEVKMRVATVLGSPRKKGNTNRVLEWIEQALSLHGHEVQRINIADHKIKGCKGCFTCKKSFDEPGCPQRDDAVEIMGRLMSCDLVLYASPIYFWGPTGQMKTFMDRHCCLVTGFGTPQWRSLMQGRHLALVITCEDGVENNTDLTTELFKRFAWYLQCHHKGTLVIPFTTTPDALSDDVKAQASSFADTITRIADKPGE